MSRHRSYTLGVALMLTLSGCERTVEREADRMLSREMSTVLRRDAERDALLLPRKVARDRTVYRYTTRDGAIADAEMGIEEGVHTTSRGGPGRPLSATEAQRRYGLPNEPEVRETIRLRRGQVVKVGKVIGGARGLGEITTAERLEGNAVKKVTPLH